MVSVGGHAVVSVGGMLWLVWGHAVVSVGGMLWLVWGACCG